MIARRRQDGLRHKLLRRCGHRPGLKQDGRDGPTSSPALPAWHGRPQLSSALRRAAHNVNSMPRDACRGQNGRAPPRHSDRTLRMPPIPSLAAPWASRFERGLSCLRQRSATSGSTREARATSKRKRLSPFKPRSAERGRDGGVDGARRQVGPRASRPVTRRAERLRLRNHL